MRRRCPNHDLHDALIAAYTSYLHTQGATDLAGAALYARGGLAHIGFERADVDILALIRKQSAASEAQIALPKS